MILDHFTSLAPLTSNGVSLFPEHIMPANRTPPVRPPRRVLVTEADVVPESWYSPGELAPLSGYSRQVVYRWCRNGFLEHRRARGSSYVKINGAVFLEFLNRQVKRRVE